MRHTTISTASCKYIQTFTHTYLERRKTFECRHVHVLCLKYNCTEDTSSLNVDPNNIFLLFKGSHRVSLFNVSIEKDLLKCSLAIYQLYQRSSLFSNISKIFQTLINKKVVEHLERNNLLCDALYGFR